MLKKLFSRKDETRRENHSVLSGRVIKYVVLRENNEETVLGHGGSVSQRNGELIVLASDKVVFRANLDSGVRMNQLLSGNGTMITGNDLENNGELRTIIVHYTG